MCPFKTPPCETVRTSPCAPATGPHVFDMRACCRYTRRRPDRTHGGVLNGHTGGFSACQASPHTTCTHTTPHTTCTHNTQHHTHTQTQPTQQHNTTQSHTTPHAHTTHNTTCTHHTHHSTHTHNHLNAHTQHNTLMHPHNTAHVLFITGTTVTPVMPVIVFADVLFSI